MRNDCERERGGKGEEGMGRRGGGEGGDESQFNITSNCTTPLCPFTSLAFMNNDLTQATKWEGGPHLSPPANEKNQSITQNTEKGIYMYIQL